MVWIMPPGCRLRRLLSGGTNWLAVKVAPWGSRRTVNRTHGAFDGSTSTSPPSSCARFAVASASATANEVPQWGGVSAGKRSSVISTSQPIASAKPSGAPISSIRASVPGLSRSRNSP